MTDDYSQTFRELGKALEFSRYRMSPIHQAILNQEIWAILNVDERGGKGFFRGKVILELGIGVGAISINLKKIQSLGVVGVDASRSMLEICRTNFSGDSSQTGDAHLIVGDIFHLPFRSLSFDSVLAIRLIENLKENDLALNEVARILRPGGQIIFDVYNKTSVPSLEDSFFSRLFRRKKRAYMHTCDLHGIVKICEFAGLLVKVYVECLFLGESSFRFVPRKILRTVMFLDRIISNMPLFSKISTRIFILSCKRNK